MLNQIRLKTLLVEDEQDYRELLSLWINETKELHLKDVAVHGIEALELLERESFDLVFLDVRLPLMNGLEVLEKIKHHPYIIFTTVSKDYAFQAFEYGALDYLHKPFSKKRFHEAVQKAISYINSQKISLGYDPNARLSIREKGNNYLVPYDKINYISANDRKSIIHSDDRDYEANKLLSELEQNLPVELFLRIHRQHIINLRKIASTRYLEGGRIEIRLEDEDDTVLIVSRSYVPDFNKRLGYEN